MDDLYNNGLDNNENGQASGGDGYGDYMPPPPSSAPPQNGYGNYPPPPQNGYGNYPPPPQNGYGNYPPPPQNGYGNYPPPPQNGYGNYPPPSQNGYGNYPPPQYVNRGAAAAAPPKDNKKALVAMIFALVNLLIFSSILTFISAPVALILAITSLVKKKDGKVMAWIAIGATAISLLIFGIYVDLAARMIPEINYFYDHHEEIMTEYDETGELPSRYKQFRAGRYKFIWKSAGFKDFDAAFDKFAEVYKEYEKEKGGISASSSRDEDTTSSAPSENYDYDHSGEDLVVLG